MREFIPYDACPICSGTAIIEHRKADVSRHPFYHPDLSAEVTWVLCSECGHSFRQGYYTEEACALLHATTTDNRKVGHDIERQRVVASRIVEKVLPHASGGAWLDVGFGNGALLFTAQEYGFTPIGVDVRQDNVDLMRRLGVEAHCQYMETLSFEGRFTVISMADVLEHMPFPLEALQTAHRLLVPGGVLFVSLPNLETIVWRLMDESNQNPYWAEIEHYHNFSRPLLYAALKDHGFEPVRYGISERYRSCMEVIAVRN